MYVGKYAIEKANQPAIIMAETGELLTYAEFDQRTNQVAHLLRSEGLNRLAHYALFMENALPYAEICGGGERSGLYYTCINSYLTADELAYILNNSESEVVFTSAAKLPIVTAALAQCPNVRRCYIIDGDAPGDQYCHYADAIADLPSTPISDEFLGTSMLYSSGTTGKPKGVFWQPHSDSIQAPHPLAGSIGAFFGFDRETLYLSPAPLYHAAPLHYNLMVLGLGGTSVIMEQFDPERSLALIEQYQITHSQWVPIMFVRMLKLPEARRSGYDLSSMKVAIHAAAPCPIDIKEQMIGWWGPVVVEYYAASESIGFTIIDSAAWLTHKGSVGRPLFGDPKIVGEDGEVLAAGEIGEIYFADSRPFEYFDEPEKTREAFNEKGWDDRRYGLSG